LASCEVYSFDENRWETLPDLPHEIPSAFATEHLGHIYITGATYILVKFDLVTKEYDIVHTTLPGINKNRILISNESKLIILSGGEYEIELDAEDHEEDLVASMDLKFTSGNSVTIGTKVYFMKSDGSKALVYDVESRDFTFSDIAY
jgi:hypothetical protein